MKHDQSIFSLLVFCSVMLSMLASCGRNRSDDTIQKEINDSLVSRGGNYSEVITDVNEAKVSLSGTCIGENCIDSLSQLVKGVEGVKEVENNVQQGQTATDLTLRTSVQAIISKYQGVQADVTGGNIILRGLVQRAQVQPLMNELGALGAKKIDNQLAVQ